MSERALLKFLPSFFQKAGGFQRQSLWQDFKGGAQWDFKGNALNDIMLNKNSALRNFYKTCCANQKL